MLTSIKKPMPFQILDVRFDDGTWFYAWNRRNYAHESMVRALTVDEIGDEIYRAAIAAGAFGEVLEAARKLVNEVSGIMGAFEFRELIGNTNFEVMRERWEEMRAVIAQAREI